MTTQNNPIHSQENHSRENTIQNLDPDYQNLDPCNHELLSALADGQLGADGQELARVLHHACEGQPQAQDLRKNWAVFHLIGEVLRAPDAAHVSQQRDLLEKIHLHMAQHMRRD